MNDLVTETYSEEDQQIIGCPSIQQVSAGTVNDKSNSHILYCTTAHLNKATCKYLWYLINRRRWKWKKKVLVCSNMKTICVVWELIIIIIECILLVCSNMKTICVVWELIIIIIECIHTRQYIIVHLFVNIFPGFTSVGSIMKNMKSQKYYFVSIAIKITVSSDRPVAEFLVLLF